jgi:prepilin-type N-terminal cleavage/methylation domain-containing protein
MKKKGFNLIEVIIVGAILGIVFLIVSPLIKSFGMMSSRVNVQNEVDREFAVVSKFIKKQVRSGRKTGDYDNVDYAGVFNNYENLYSYTDENSFFNSTTTTDSMLFIEVPDGSDSKFEFFIHDSTNKQLKYSEDFDSSSEEVLMENVEDASFQFEDGVVTFFIDLDVGDYEGKIKDSIKESAVSRINMDL